MGSVDKLITPMELTDEVLNTQFHDTVNDYKTLGYNLKLQVRGTCRKNQRSI